MSGNSLLHNCIQIEKMYSTSNATPCGSGVNSISDSGAVVNANVGATAVKPLQSSGPELLNKNGPLCEEEVARLREEFRHIWRARDTIGEEIDKSFADDNLKVAYRNLCQRWRELSSILAEYRDVYPVHLPPEPELTAYGKILIAAEDITDPLGFYEPKEASKALAPLRSQMCKYHCDGGVVGKITPAATTATTVIDNKTGKRRIILKSWKAGCAGHDHSDPNYPCSKVHVGDIFVENVTSENTQTESPATAADDNGMSVIGAGGGPVMTNAVEAVGTTIPIALTVDVATSGPIRSGYVAELLTRATTVSDTASNESTGLCLGSNAGAGGVSVERGQHESLGSCTRKQAKLSGFISSNRHDSSKGDQVNEAICDLEESGQFDEYSGEDDEKDEDEVKQEQKNRAIIAEEKFKTFRVFEQRSVFWDALVKCIEGRMKPLNGEMLHLMSKLQGVLQQIHSLCRFKGQKTEKHFKEIASYQKQYDTITARMVEVKNVYSDLYSKLEKYYKNYQDCSNQELQYVHEIEELMPGRIDGDPEKGILPHVMEDRKAWMIADRFDVLDETIASFLGRNMTAEEKDDLLHSQNILVGHLQKFDCYVESKFV